MGEGLKRALVAFQKYRLVKRIIAAIAGAVAGIAGCITFAKVYHNYNAAVWAGLSAAFAIVFLRLNFSVRRDYERVITRETFKAYLLIGVLGTVAGFVALITYIVLGATHHEKGLPAEGYFVVCFWSAKTVMWGVCTMGSARSFTKKYFESSPGLVQNNSIY
ncbi:heme transporter HRG1-like [Orbicella faveolata]|uniref:heme transporter HRG1-like n=1 Tax=Orbicella faveolata TaxID=48498 RepID=UPI0009E52431|nr:heme transporter HRG1-like [Orbicella faveolata]